MKKISRKTAKALEKIAMSASYSLEYRGGIDERNNDSEDFPEISIRALQEMLEQAYLLGRTDAEGKI